SQCDKDDFKKSHNRKAHLKKKFKCKSKSIQILVQSSTMQVKDQVIVQKEASSGPATQAYKENMSLQNKVQESAYREKIPFDQNEIQETIKDGNIEMKQSDI
ncbi:14093_t:CDS:1, partial [Gigaspora margarita]